jgi:chorismate dehydratase
MKEPLRTLRIGKIDFTNVWPVFHYFPVAAFGSSIEVSSQVPTELNRNMLEGSIDIGPISSFAYAESHDRYVILPDLSVSAYGSVHSILLFYRDSLETVKNGRIALTTASATSVNLLKIILQKFHGGKPEYSFAAPSLHDMMEGMDGALLIGDDAIRASWEQHDYHVLDLGAEWTRLTGCWMTFALWAVRREALNAMPGLISEIQAAFLDSKMKGRTDPTGVVDAALDRLGGSPEFWHQYFSDISYEFSDIQKSGLLLYYHYAIELGLLAGEIPLNIWNDTKTLQVNE